MSRDKQCNHKYWDQERRGQEHPTALTIRSQCADCGITFSLGPSNDESDSVSLEMRAAEHIAGLAPDWDDADVWDDGEGNLAFGSSPHPADIWSWSISRPIAEQLAETARDDADADSLVTDFPLTVSIDSDEQGLAIQINGLDTAPPLLSPDEADTLANDLMVAANRVRYEATRSSEPDCRDEDVPVLCAEVLAGCDACEAPFESERKPMSTGPATDAVCACTGDALLSETCEVSP